MANKTSSAKKAGTLPDGIREELTRNIKRNVESMLWGRAAGRCEFQGCNRLLSRSPVTQETVNISEKAHIFSFSEGGSRGNDGVDDEELNSVENLILVCHDCHKNTPALVVGTSGTVTPDRIEMVLGPDVSLWSVTIPRPNNDPVKSREDLARFRALLRGLFDDIKAAHGQWTPLHVFPVTSVSLAVEFGRARMPKADMPWRIYDQNNKRDGFIPTLDIPLGG